MTEIRARLSAEERRAAVLDCACAIFSRGSYRGTTTAEIARHSGVTEPILYRHFTSKRDLYLSCMEAMWEETRQMWDDAVAAEPDPGLWVGAMGQAYLATREKKGQLANLWIQALTEAGDDPEIRKFLRRHMQQVHEYVVDVIERAQAAGGVLPDRDASAEAWIFISLGLLGTVGRRLGGLVGEDFPRIMASRRRWMTGRE